jgi:hypothetical protein
MRRPAFGPGWAGSVTRFGLVLLIPVVAGCEAGQGQVSGRVLFDGKPLPGGRLTFRPADPRQNSVSAELDPGGNYQVVLPAGEVQVCVDNRELEPRGAAIGAVTPDALSPEMKALLGGTKTDKSPPPKAQEGTAERPAGRYVPIPERYYDLETAGLRFTVKRGEQKHDLILSK